MTKVIKLPIGQKNIPYIKVKAGYADGAKQPKRRAAIKNESVFNGIILRKAA